jgi:ribosomal protein S4
MTRNESVKKWSRWKKFKHTESREDMQLTSKSWRDSFVEKQAVKAYYYGFNETAMKTLWKSESGKIGKVINNLESRLSTFLVSNHFAQSPLQAHQWIAHKHVRVNNNIVKHPKYVLIPGDVIHLNYLAIEQNNDWIGFLSSVTNTCQRDNEGKTWVFDPKTNTIVYLGTNSSSPFSNTTWERVREFYIR